MNRRKVTTLGILLIAAASALLLTESALANGGGYEIDWWNADASAASSSGGSYELLGIIGQPATGEEMSGGSYSLLGGFLTGIEIGVAFPEMDVQGNGQSIPDGEAHHPRLMALILVRLKWVEILKLKYSPSLIPAVRILI